MPEIRLEGYEVWASGVGHLYLVYVDNGGNEYVIRGGPADFFTDIEVEIGVPMAESEDSRPNTQAARDDRGSVVLDLGGQDPAVVWAAMLEAAAQINDADLNYETEGPNSNTTIAKILEDLGFDIEDVLPTTEGIEGNQTLGYGPWEGIEDIGDMANLPGTENLIAETALEYYETKQAVLENALGFFFENGEIPEFDEDHTPYPEFDETFTEGAYLALLALLGDLAEEVEEYVEENEDDLTEAQEEELNDIAESAQAAYENAALAYIDPLVVDLDGDGVETVSFVDAEADFDLFEGEGLAASHGWISPDDGFLGLDENGNGTIDGLGELFGSATVSGFAALSALDTDHDGMITAADDQFSSLVIWQDLNGDGTSQSGEVETLGHWGISAIDLDGQDQNLLDNGNLISSSSSVEFADGTVTEIADIHFGIDMASLTSNGEADIFDFSSMQQDGRLDFFEDGLDQILLSGSSYDSLELVETGYGVIVTTDEGHDLFVADVAASDLTADDFLFA
jgi:hypothetical protein